MHKSHKVQPNCNSPVQMQPSHEAWNGLENENMIQNRMLFCLKIYPDFRNISHIFKMFPKPGLPGLQIFPAVGELQVGCTRRGQ